MNSFATDEQRAITPETATLYMHGFRVNPDGIHVRAGTDPTALNLWRLTLRDDFANTRLDFGLHESEAMAWDIARRWIAKSRAIMPTSNA